MASAPTWLTRRPIAHRGWHDLAQGRAENSLSAFRAAADADFAIECDVQLTADGTAVVFHDDVLDRLTAEGGPVVSRTAAELARLRVLGTADTIHTLQRHLELVAGRVPVIIELKSCPGRADALTKAVAEALADYDGPAAVMSFDHELCERFAAAIPDRPRGLTAQGDAATGPDHVAAMNRYDLGFVSYDVNALPHPFVSDMRRSGVPVITWTVRTPDQVARTREHADQMTFEGFDPRRMADG